MWRGRNETTDNVDYQNVFLALQGLIHYNKDIK